jgi:pimeloyl-ACP methyl ester carboxylesterase
MQTIELHSQSMRSSASPSSLDRASTTKPSAERPLLYEVTGQGDPIVLMPGTLTGWIFWIAHAEQLASHHTVIRAQLRNVELAEAGQPIPASYAFTTERDALLATVNSLGLETFDLAGWSSGAMAALVFALEYPQRVRTLTLIEPPAFWVLRATGYPAKALAPIEAADRALLGKEVTIDDLKEFLVRAGLGDAGADFESHPRWPVMVRNRQAISTNAVVWNYTDSLERLRSLDMPILAVKGSDTADFLAAGTERIAAIAPDATLLELPGGHACHIENIDRFLEALEAHLSGIAVR